MKFKKGVNKILKMYKKISISNKAIIEINIYLNKLLDLIKLNFIQSLIVCNKKGNFDIFTGTWSPFSKQKATSSKEGSPFPKENSTFPSNNKPTKLRLFKLKQLLACILPFSIYKYSIEYSNNVLMEYLRQRQKKEKLTNENSTPRSRSYDRDLTTHTKIIIFSPKKIKKYYRESDIKMIEKSYIFLAIIFEWIVNYIFNKIIGENPNIEKINISDVQKILNLIDF